MYKTIINIAINYSVEGSLGYYCKIYVLDYLDILLILCL